MTERAMKDAPGADLPRVAPEIEPHGARIVESVRPGYGSQA